MKEYIVGFTDDADMERFERLHGTNGELVRCKDCTKAQICIMYRSDKDPYGFCRWAVRKEE